MKTEFSKIHVKDLKFDRFNIFSRLKPKIAVHYMLKLHFEPHRKHRDYMKDIWECNVRKQSIFSVRITIEHVDEVQSICVNSLTQCIRRTI